VTSVPPSKINSLLEQLVAISTDLKAMLAVHDERLNHQERQTENLGSTVEKRREELDTKLKDVYDTMREQDNNIFAEISKLRQESTEAHKELNNRISQLEKYIWFAIGGGIVISWIATNLANYLRIFH
jgi:peptidoglycan hydrolase CwlO-like protein